MGKKSLTEEEICKLVEEGNGHQLHQLSAQLPLDIHLLLLREKRETGVTLRRILAKRLRDSYRNNQ